MTMRPRIAVFSGANATVTNSPPLVTSNKARLPDERMLQGKFDHLVPQYLYEPVTVRIKKFSAHPLEEDAREVYQDEDDGKPYYEVTLKPEDGLYLLPYMARRKGSGPGKGVPFEASDLSDRSLDFGGRQSFYPDASRIFEEIDRALCGRGMDGEGNLLSRRADYDFVRVIPSGGYTKKGEKMGVDIFPYRPEAKAKSTRTGDLARVANSVQRAFDTGLYDGGIWLDGSPQQEESIYWLSLMVDTDKPIVGVSAQRPHGQLSDDGARNLVDAVDYVTSGKGVGMGGVVIVDQCIYAAREVTKAASRPGGYVATGGRGGVLGSIDGLFEKSTISISYGPTYRHTSSSLVNVRRLGSSVTFEDTTDGDTASAVIKSDQDGSLLPQAIPRVEIFKHANYSQTDESEDPRSELSIMGFVDHAVGQMKEATRTPSGSKGAKALHGIVLEGSGGYAKGTRAQSRALELAALNGIPVARVLRGHPSASVITNRADLTIEAGNLTANKARLLLIASMLKLGRLPRAREPENPTSSDREKVIAKVGEFQQLFETH